MSIKIGTRKSKLALAQTNMVVNEIKKYFPSINIEVVHFTTKGDKVLNKPLINIGGKGVFVTEIEDALINKEIDLAVHSAKDLPLQLQDNLTISAGKIVINTGSSAPIVLNLQSPQSFQCCLRYLA